MHAWTFRTPLGPTARAIFGLNLAAWVGSFFLFAYGTDLGRAQLSERGFAGMFLGWLVISIAISGGYVLGYWLMRNFAPGQRAYREREVLRLVLGEAFLAACGGFVIGFIPMTITGDPLLMLAWTFFLGWVFTVAVLLPRYTTSWRAAVEEGLGHDG